MGKEVSLPKRKVKSSVNRQVKAGLSAVKDFLAGRSAEAQVAATEDKATREVVAAELLAAMSGRSAEVAAGENAAGASSSDTQEIPGSDISGAKDASHGNAQQPEAYVEPIIGAEVEGTPGEQAQAETQGKRNRSERGNFSLNTVTLTKRYRI